MKLPIFCTTACLAGTMIFTSCESPTATGAVAGAAAGGLAGLAHGGRNAPLIGAAAGAGIGALLGHIIGHADDRGYYEGRRLPYGRWVGRGLVESPYYPNNVIDTRGIPPGSVIEDPTTGGRFIKP